MNINSVVNINCIDGMAKMPDLSVNLTITDIPYDAVNRASNGLRVLDKRGADVRTFDLEEFIAHVDRVTKGTIIIFCGKEQFSGIYADLSKRSGTVRPIVWNKTNPSPMNGQHVYLSGVELGVWFRKRGAPFNAFCKNTVFSYPNGRSKIHPTEKNHCLLKELIIDNSVIDDIVFDPCAGSGSHLLVAKQNSRRFFGFEIDPDWATIAQNRLK